MLQRLAVVVLLVSFIGACGVGELVRTARMEESDGVGAAESAHVYSGYYPADKNRLTVHFSAFMNLGKFSRNPDSVLRKIRSSAVDVFAVPWRKYDVAYTSSAMISSDYETMRLHLESLRGDGNIWSNDGARMRKPITPLLNFSRLVGQCEGTAPTVSGSVVTNPRKLARLAEVSCFAIAKDDRDRQSFRRELREGLRLAKSVGSPVLMLDHEPYLNYEAVKLGVVVKHYREIGTIPAGVTAHAYVLGRLRALGEGMADDIDDSYPTVDILVLAAKFEKLLDATGKPVFEDDTPVQAAVLYFMLRRAAALGYRFKLYEGGENLMWYPKYSNAYGVRQIQNQETKSAPALARFPGNFALAGTIAFWHDFWTEYNEENQFYNKRPDDVEVANEYLYQLVKPLASVMRHRKYTWIYPKYGGRHVFDVYELYDGFKGSSNHRVTAAENRRFTRRVDAKIRIVKKAIREYCSVKSCE